MPWRPLEHTADLGIEVDAASLEGLFADAARGLLETITDASTVALHDTVELRLAAAALDLLLVEWLEELLFRFDASGELWAEHALRLDEVASGGWSLRATSRGEPYAPGRHPLRTQVKAITYHGLEVRRDGETWRARVIFDL
jgi:SHS2 domain-containing protein